MCKLNMFITAVCFINLIDFCKTLETDIHPRLQIHVTNCTSWVFEEHEVRYVSGSQNIESVVFATVRKLIFLWRGIQLTKTTRFLTLFPEITFI